MAEGAVMPEWVGPFLAGTLVGTAVMWVFAALSRMREADRMDQWDRDRWRR